MSAERDLNRIVRSWLRTDEHDSADAILGIVLSRLDTTPQRRPWWPARRINRMNRQTQAIVAAAAVVVVAIVGYSLLPQNGPSVGGQQTTAPTSLASLGPTTGPTREPGFPAKGDLTVGRHTMIRNGVRLSIGIPTPGWTSDGDFGLSRGTEGDPGAAGFIFWSEPPTGVFADPCGDVRAPTLGKDRAALAAAVAAIPGVDVVREPQEATVAGRPARFVAVAVREDVGCEARAFHLWYAGAHRRFASQLGFTIWIWIVDVDGAIVWIEGETYKGAGPEPAAASQQSVDSIRVE